MTTNESLEQLLRELASLNSTLYDCNVLEDLGLSEYGKSILLQVYNQSLRFNNLYELLKA